MASPEQFQELMSFVTERTRGLRARAREGLANTAAAPPDLLEGLDEWLALVGTDAVVNVPNLLGIGESPAADAALIDNTEPLRLSAEFDEHTRVLSGTLNAPPNDRQVNDVFRSLETTVLTSYGFSFSVAEEVASSLLSFRDFRRGQGRDFSGPLGNGIATLADSASQQLSAGFLSVAALKSVLRRGRLGVLLSVAIEADGRMVDGLELLMPSAVAGSVCRLSQLLAEAKGYYEASKPW